MTTASAPELFWVECPRDVLMVEGPGALEYLQSQVSQDLRGLAVGGAAASLVLEPNGRVQSLVRIVRSGEHALVVDVDPGHGDALAARLQRFKIRVQAEITAIPWRCLSVRGPGAADVPPSPGSVVVPAWWSDGTAVDLLGPSPVPPPGIPEGSAADLEAARVRAVWPAMGAEITEATLPAELGLNDVAVSFTKGCYPGQELVERMDSRGASAPRSLQRIPAAGHQVGDALVVDGVEIGRVTSVAGDWALALVKRGALAADAQASASD
jgi:folate-binding protein YgfZ